MNETRTIHVLGPQRKVPTLRDALATCVSDRAPVAAITAGWEERESEYLEMGDHVARPVLNLELYRRAEEVFREDPELGAALRERHDLLTELQRLYRIRLRHLVPAATQLLEAEGSEDLLESERDAAFQNLRDLDAHHVERVRELAARFAAQWQPWERHSIARHRQELGAILGEAQALLVAGGHVGILYNRLWLFGIADLLPERMPLFVWSAGAMALSEQVALFHDDPPQGQGHAEVLGPGIGLLRGIVPLPHANKRLRLQDSVRVQLLARRFPDTLCVALDRGTGLKCEDGQWVAELPTMQLTRQGTLEMVGAEA